MPPTAATPAPPWLLHCAACARTVATDPADLIRFAAAQWAPRCCSEAMTLYRPEPNPAAALAPPAYPGGPPRIAAPLTAREEQVLRLLARGHTPREAAAELGLSVPTVESHKTQGQAKLGLTSRVALVRYAVQNGWLADL